LAPHTLNVPEPGVSTPLEVNEPASDRLPLPVSVAAIVVPP
jgi:hypothetical protein